MNQTTRWLCLSVTAVTSLAAFAESEQAPLGAPSILLARTLSSEPGHQDIGSNVWPVEDGALLTGWSHPGPHTMPQGVLMKVDPDGEVIWRNEPVQGLLWQVLPDPRGGYVVVGFGPVGGSWDAWILHIDGEGIVNWSKHYGGPAEDRMTAIQTTDYGWIAVGQSDTGGESGIDAWVLRIDGEGNELSSWLTGGEGTDRAFNIQPTPDGGAIICGMDGVDPDADYFVTRLGPDGKVIWTRQPELPGFQVAHDIQRYADGDYLVVGYGYASEERNIDGFVQRYSLDGELRFEATFGGNTYDRANHGRIFPDGTLAIIGYSQRPDATDDEHGWDMVFHHLDAAGSPMRALRFGGAGFEYGRSIAGAPEDLWLIGHSSSGREGSGFFIVRLDLMQPL